MNNSPKSSSSKNEQKDKPRDFELIELLFRDKVPIRSDISSNPRASAQLEDFVTRFQSSINQIPSYLHSVEKPGFFTHYWFGVFSTVLDTRLAEKLGINKLHFRFDDAKTLKVVAETKDNTHVFIFNEDISKKDFKFTKSEWSRILGLDPTPLEEGKLKIDIINIRKENQGIRVQRENAKIYQSSTSTVTNNRFQEIKPQLNKDNTSVNRIYLENYISELSNSDAKKVETNFKNFLDHTKKVHNSYPDLPYGSEEYSVGRSRYTKTFREANHSGFIVGTLMNYKYRYNAKIYPEKISGSGQADIIALFRGPERISNAVPIFSELKASDMTSHTAFTQTDKYTPGLKNLLTNSNQGIRIGVNLDFPTNIVSEVFNIKQTKNLVFENILNDINDWRKEELSKDRLEKRVKASFSSEYNAFPGTKESTNQHYFSRYILGQSLLVDINGENNLKKYLFSYSESPLKDERIRDVKAPGPPISLENNPVTTLVFIQGNNLQDQTAFIFHIQEDSTKNFSDKKIPITSIQGTEKVNNVVEMHVSLMHDPKDQSFDNVFRIDKIDKYKLNNHDNTQKLSGNFIEIPSSDTIKHSFDSALDSQRQSDIRSNAYKNLLSEEVAKIIFPIKSFIKNEAEFQGFLSGLYSSYRDLKLKESVKLANPNQKLIVAPEFQIGGGGRADMITQAIGPSDQGTKEYTPILSELKVDRKRTKELSNTNLAKKVEDLTKDQTRRYAKGAGIKAITDSNSVGVMGIMYNPNAKTYKNLIITTPITTAEVVHSSITDHKRKVNLRGCLRNRGKRSTGYTSCLISWEDIDKFNAETEDRRNFDKIKISSEKFLTHLSNVEYIDKQLQLVQLADEVTRSTDNEEKIVGKFQDQVNKLVNEEPENKDELKEIIDGFIDQDKEENSRTEIVDFLRSILNKLKINEKVENLQALEEASDAIGLTLFMDKDISNENESDHLIPYEPLEENVEISSRINARLYTNIAHLFSLEGLPDIPDKIASNNLINYNTNIGNILSEGEVNHSTREKNLLKNHYNDAENFISRYPENSLLDLVKGDIDLSNSSWLLDNGKHSLIVYYGDNHYKLYSQDYNYRVIFQAKDATEFSDIEKFARKFFRWRSGSSEYKIFTLPDNIPQEAIDKLKQSNFWNPEQVASDLMLLEKGTFSNIEQIPAKVVRELFLLDDKVPEITSLHEDFFKTYSDRLSLKIQDLHKILENITPEQSDTLNQLINQYDFRIDTNYINTLPKDQKDILESYHKIVKDHLKKSTSITAKDLSNLSWKVLEEKMAKNENISPELRNEAIENIKNLHEASASRWNKMGGTTQALFFAPDIIRAANTGDYTQLAKLGGMVGGDTAFNHMYETLINKLEPVLSSSRVSLLKSLPISSPIFKILTIHSIIDLHKELDTLPHDSERRDIIKHQLGEQYFTVGLMVGEMFGASLGPIWIGLMIEQNLYGAYALRKQYHLDISFGESFLLNLGFNQEKLQTILEERSIVDMNLELVNTFSNQTKTSYDFSIVKVYKESYERAPISADSYIDFIPSNHRSCLEDNVFQEETSGHKRISSVVNNDSTYCVDKSLLQINGEGLTAFYKNTKASNHIRNIAAFFDPREGKLKLNFTSKGLEALDKIDDNHYNSSSPYTVSIQVTKKPYKIPANTKYPHKWRDGTLVVLTLPGSLLIFPGVLENIDNYRNQYKEDVNSFENSAHNFTLTDTSKRIVSKYYIDSSAKFNLIDDTNQGSIIFIKDKDCNSLRIVGTTKKIKVIESSLDSENRNYVRSSIQLGDKNYLNINTGGIPVQNLVIDVPNISIADVHGTPSLPAELIVYERSVLNANINLGPNVKLSLGPPYSFNLLVFHHEENLHFSNLEININPHKAVYSFKKKDLKVILDSLNQIDTEFPNKIKFNCVEKSTSNLDLCICYNKNIAKNTIRILGELNESDAYLDILEKKSVLHVPNRNLIEVFHFSRNTYNTIELDLNLIRFNKVIKPIDYHTSYYHNNIYGNKMLNNWLILEFTDNNGNKILNHFKYDYDSNNLNINGINYIVKENKIYAKLDGDIDGNKLLRFNDKKTIAVFVASSLNNSKSYLQEGGLNINNCSLSNISNQTSIIFQDSEYKTVPRNYKFLLDSLNPTRNKRQIRDYNDKNFDDQGNLGERHIFDSPATTLASPIQTTVSWVKYVGQQVSNLANSILGSTASDTNTNNTFSNNSDPISHNASSVVLPNNIDINGHIEVISGEILKALLINNSSVSISTTYETAKQSLDCIDRKITFSSSEHPEVKEVFYKDCILDKENTNKIKLNSRCRVEDKDLYCSTSETPPNLGDDNKIGEIVYQDYTTPFYRISDKYLGALDQEGINKIESTFTCKTKDNNLYCTPSGIRLFLPDDQVMEVDYVDNIRPNISSLRSTQNFDINSQIMLFRVAAYLLSKSVKKLFSSPEDLFVDRIKNLVSGCINREIEERQEQIFDCVRRGGKQLYYCITKETEERFFDCIRRETERSPENEDRPGIRIFVASNDKVAEIVYEDAITGQSYNHEASIKEALKEIESPSNINSKETLIPKVKDTALDYSRSGIRLLLRNKNNSKITEILYKQFVPSSIAHGSLDQNFTRLIEKNIEYLQEEGPISDIKSEEFKINKDYKPAFNTELSLPNTTPDPALLKQDMAAMISRPGSSNLLVTSQNSNNQTYNIYSNHTQNVTRNRQLGSM